MSRGRRWSEGGLRAAGLSLSLPLTEQALLESLMDLTAPVARRVIFPAVACTAGTPWCQMTIITGMVVPEAIGTLGNLARMSAWFNCDYTVVESVKFKNAFLKK